MTSGRATDEDEDEDQGFRLRTVMAMVPEVVQARATMERFYVQFGALAASLGVIIRREDHIGL